MPRFSNLKKSLLALAVFGIVTLAQGTAKADPITVCTESRCSTTSVTGTIVTGNGTGNNYPQQRLTNVLVAGVIQTSAALISR